MSDLRAFARFLWRDHRRAMLVVAVASAALSLTEGVGLLMLVPMLQQVGVSTSGDAADHVSRALESVLRAAGLEPTLLSVLVLVVALVTLRATLQWILAVWEARLEAGVIGRLRQRLFAAVVAMPWARFTGERPAALQHAIGPQVDDVHSALLLLLQGASLTAAVAAAAAVALVVSPALTVIVGVSGALLFWLARQLRAPGRAEGDALLAASIGLFARISELLGGLKMVHAHGAEERAVAAVAADTAMWTSLTERTALRRGLVSLALAVASAFVLGVLVWLGVSLAHLSPATLLLLLLLYARLVPRVSELQATASSLGQTLASYRSVAALLTRCAGERDNADGRLAALPRLPARAPDLAVRGITVRYPATEGRALVDFSARFDAGTITVVTGPSGAGKTTLGDVLLGLLAPEVGDVLVDGAPLAALPRTQWCARVGYLAQEPMLFHGTIRENLLFAHPDASHDELRAALRDAACDFVHRLPHGLDAPIGERGVMLSGGERQRLALARALLRQPDLLVLDEATSALDAETETRILDTLHALKGRCTVVFCTHREAPTAIADQLLRL